MNRKITKVLFLETNKVRDLLSFFGTNFFIFNYTMHEIVFYIPERNVATHYGRFIDTDDTISIKSIYDYQEIRWGLFS